MPTPRLCRSAVLLTAIALAAAVHNANAVPIEFKFTGTVSSVDDGLGGTFSVGDQVSGIYIFESTTADSNNLPQRGEYNGTVRSFSFRKGGYAGAAMAGNITVDNDANGFDPYVVTIPSPLTAPAVDGFALGRFALTLSDSTESVFNNDSLPLTPPALAGFDSRLFQLVYTKQVGMTFQIRSVLGNVTSLVIPEPPSLMLFGIAGLSLFGGFWRRRRTEVKATGGA